MQTFTAPVSENYKLEVWGAAGDDPTGPYGGEGAYSYGKYPMSSNETIYLCIGQKGFPFDFSRSEELINKINWHAYNGGSYGQCGGGGASHIATTNRGVLANYENYQSEVLIVSGGGGGGEGAPGGDAGPVGENGSKEYSIQRVKDKLYTVPTGGTQTTGGQAGTTQYGTGFDGIFGQGGHGVPNTLDSNDAAIGGGGGGGGWYGGGGLPYAGGGAGGSSHIGSGIINGVMETGGNTGNGRIRITWQQLPQ